MRAGRVAAIASACIARCDVRSMRRQRYVDLDSGRVPDRPHWVRTRPRVHKGPEPLVRHETSDGHWARRRPPCLAYPQWCSGN